MVNQSTVAADTVQAIMSTNVQTVDFGAPVTQALRLMAEDKFNTVPVVNGDRECVGMLSRSDLTEILFAEDKQLGQLVGSEAFSQFSAGVIETCGDKQVREVMTHGVTSVQPTTSIKSACQLMNENKIHHLPVVSKQGVLEGIVSTFDIIGWMATQ